MDRRLNMGGTLVCDAAIRAGSLDAYAEYSGTALTAILHEPVSTDREEVNRKVTEAYKTRSLTWGSNLGFNDTFAMIAADYAARLGLQNPTSQVIDRYNPSSE